MLEGAVVKWPAESKLTRSDRQPTLLLFAHPHCPCTRATIGELALLMRHAAGVSATVVFTEPAGVPEDWMETDLGRSASAIPGVKQVRDDRGFEAKNFGATTSGFAVLYAPDGKLLFRGGITDGRGHAGDNEGRSAILSLIAGRTATATTRVFGCPLFAKASSTSPTECHPE